MMNTFSAPFDCKVHKTFAQAKTTHLPLLFDDILYMILSILGVEEILLQSQLVKQKALRGITHLKHNKYVKLSWNSPDDKCDQ